jgi:hypothetical protein
MDDSMGGVKYDRWRLAAHFGVIQYATARRNAPRQRKGVNRWHMKDVQQAGGKNAQSLRASLKRDNEKHIEALVAAIERRAREGKLL